MIFIHCSNFFIINYFFDYLLIKVYKKKFKIAIIDSEEVLYKSLESLHFINYLLFLDKFLTISMKKLKNKEEKKSYHFIKNLIQNQNENIINKLIKTDEEIFILNLLRSSLNLQFDENLILIPVEFLKFIATNYKQFEKTMEKNPHFYIIIVAILESYFHSFINILKHSDIYIIIAVMAYLTKKNNINLIILKHQNIKKTIFIKYENNADLFNQ